MIFVELLLGAVVMTAGAICVYLFQRERRWLSEQMRQLEQCERDTQRAIDELAAKRRAKL